MRAIQLCEKYGKIKNFLISITNKTDHVVTIKWEGGGLLITINEGIKTFFDDSSWLVYKNNDLFACTDKEFRKMLAYENNLTLPRGELINCSTFNPGLIIEFDIWHSMNLLTDEIYKNFSTLILKTNKGSYKIQKTSDLHNSDSVSFIRATSQKFLIPSEDQYDQIFLR